MSNAEFPKPVMEVVGTLAEIFRHRHNNEIVEILESARAYFQETNYDNWNGGTYTWGLRLEVPARIFAALGERLTVVEGDINRALGYLERLHPNDHIGDVAIVPIAPGSSAIGQRIAPSELEVRRLWPDGRFRLFLSHVARHKVSVSTLKQALTPLGVSSFVAHEDIEPSLEWRAEIELALRSMHALAALGTLEFHESKWTDQEVGWAFGRGVLVLPIHLGAEPYGFAAKTQYIRGTFDGIASLAFQIVKALIANTQTHGEMRRALVNAFASAGSSATASDLQPLIVAIDDFADDEKSRIQQACVQNPQIAGASGVPKAIYDVFGKPLVSCF